jgi:ribosomal subunit interface protein
MRILVHHSNVQISGALADHVDHKIGLAIRRFQERIAAVTVRIIDENGPRGGVDTRCRVIVQLVGGGRIVIKAIAEDAYAAVSRAATRLHAQVTRAVSRRKGRSSETRHSPAFPMW